MKNTITILLLFFVINLFGQMPNTLSSTDKIYGLSKFWQEVNYNFVYLSNVDKKLWEDTYKQLITEVQDSPNDYEYYRLLQKFCALLKDGHTNVYFPPEINKDLYNTWFGDYRLFLSNIDGKAIITRTNLSKKDEIPVGTEIVKVDGMETSAYLEKFVKPYISSSTDYIVDDLAIGGMLRAPKGTSFDLELKLPTGEIKSLTLTHAETTEKEVHPPFENRALLDFKWLENNIAYVSLNSFSDPKIDTLFIDKLPELYKAEKLIIDLRYNGGGSTNIGYQILQYLTNDDVLLGSRTFSRLHIPSFKAWGMWTEAKDTIGNEWATQEFLSFHDQFYHEFPYHADSISLDAKRIVVPTVVLIGHNTASAAEDFLIAADKQAHFTKIGEPTFGSTGQPMMFDLPGGGSARVCTKKDTYPDGRPFVGVGIQPDIEVKRTLQDYIENRDVVLERAIEFLNK